MEETNQNEALFIERGNAAEHLLTSEMFQMASNELVNYYLSQFVTSKATDKETREASYHAVKAVQDLSGLLNQWVAVRDQIIANNDQSELEI